LPRRPVLCVGRLCARALSLTVNGQSPGFDDVRFAGAVDGGRSTPGSRFAPETTERAVAYGNAGYCGGASISGRYARCCTRPRSEEKVVGGERVVEVVMNGPRGRESLRCPPNGAVAMSFRFKSRSSRAVGLHWRHSPSFTRIPSMYLSAKRRFAPLARALCGARNQSNCFGKNRSRHIAVKRTGPDRPALPMTEP